VATSSGVARNEAILSILFEEDDDESEFLTALQGVTTAAVTWESLYEYAAVEHYYTYEGSRTTPDCRETVTWIVDSNVRDATTAQINFYA
jgi:carbonic anhydrase